MGEDSQITMFGLRLLLVAAVPSAVAFTAPTSSTEPAEELDLVQAPSTSGPVADLQKQYSTLQVDLQSKTYAQVTPAVKNTISQMIVIIQTEIEPVFPENHRLDQAELDTSMQAIKEYVIAQQEKQNFLFKRAKGLSGKIKEHNAMVPQWTVAAKAFQAADKKWTDTFVDREVTCCAKAKAGVTDRAYLEPFARCDFKSKDADSCVDRAEKSVEEYTADKFSKGLKLYKGLTTKCAYLVAEEPKTHAAFISADNACDSVARNARSTAVYIRGAKTDTKISHEEKERQQEWTSVQVIKCMLTNYQTGGGFDDKSLKKCSGKAADIEDLKLDHLVGQIPKRIKWVPQTFKGLTPYTHPKACDKLVQQKRRQCHILPEVGAPTCKFVKN